MLTLNLRKLERDGLLIRTVYPTVPPKVEYSLTPIARELGDSFAALTAWAERHRHAIAAETNLEEIPASHLTPEAKRTRYGMVKKVLLEHEYILEPVYPG